MNVVILILLALATRAVGDFRDDQYRLIEAVIAYIAWLRVPMPQVWSPSIQRLLRWSSGLLFVGLLVSVDPFLKIALIAGMLLLMRRPYLTVSPEAPDNDKPRARIEALIITCALYAVLWAVFFAWPVGWNGTRLFAYWYSAAMTQFLHPPLILGPWGGSFDILLLGIAFIIGVQRRVSGSLINALVSMALLLIGQVIYWSIANPLGVWLVQYYPMPSAMHLWTSPLYLAFVWIVGSYLQHSQPVRLPTDAAQQQLPRRIGWMLAGLAAVVLLLGRSPIASTPAGTRVMILDKKSLDWSIPTHQRYGDRSGGMFGLLPHYLKAAGCSVFRSDITPGVLDTVDVLIIANLIDSLPTREHLLVDAFLDRGGGILILGDHTGFGHIREPSNALLERFGMSLEFDTAKPMRQSWDSERAYLYHAIGHAGGRMDADIWLGASLETAFGTEPTIVGRGAFSDYGDYNNEGRSYLGDLAYNLGEELGGIVLAAAARDGAGRAVLHGDTSPFQNGAFFNSQRMANRTIAWLAAGGLRGWWDYWRLWIAALLLTAASVFAIGWRRGDIAKAAVLCACPVLLFSLNTLSVAGEHTRWDRDTAGMALVDDSHGHFMDLMSWEDFSIGGLQFNLLRAGYMPRRMAGAEDGALEHAEVFVIMAPGAPYDAGEVARLVEWVDGGGWIIAAGGVEQRDALAALYDEFGLEILNVPLGKAEGVGLGEQPKFWAAYPVVGDTAQVLAQAFDYSVAVAARHGDAGGGLVAIGDPQFFLNRNLEGKDAFHVIENIQFLDRIFEHVIGYGGLRGEE